MTSFSFAYNVFEKFKRYQLFSILKTLTFIFSYICDGNEKLIVNFFVRGKMGKGKKRLRGGAHTRRSRPHLSSAELEQAMNVINHPRAARQRRRNVLPLPVNPPVPAPAGMPLNSDSGSETSEDEGWLPQSNGMPVHVNIHSTHVGPILPYDTTEVLDPNQLYTDPREAIEWVFSNGLVNPHNGKLYLSSLENALNEIRHSNHTMQSERVYKPVEFAENEIWRLKYGSDNSIFPIYTNLGYLLIPGRDIRDLPLYMMIYILLRLSQVPARGSFAPMVSINDGPAVPINGITIDNRTIPWDDVRRIFNTMIGGFITLVNGNDNYIVEWTGSVESGLYIILKLNKPVKFLLSFFEFHSVQHGGRWTPEIGELLKKVCGTSVVTVMNKEDDKCLIYCLVMGLLIVATKNTLIFGRGKTGVEPYEVTGKGLYYFTSENFTPLIERMRELARCIFPPIYSEGDVPVLYQYVEDIDRRVGTSVSTKKFKETFEELESFLLPQKVCGVDVYGIDFNINKHVYPLYISKTREPLIQLICVTPKDAGFSHYGVITNFQRLMKTTGGKQFFSCSKCGLTFYHRRSLTDHACVTRVREGDSGLGYHFSSKDARKNIDPIVGSCTKCRLDFTDEFRYEYHKKHCLMEGITGYKHVQLVKYGEGAPPFLTGDRVDMEQEDKHVANRRVMYADFESTIDPESGEHSFMSYGLYDWDRDIYYDGGCLLDFLSMLEHLAFEGGQEHLYVFFHNAMGYDANFILRSVLGNHFYDTWGIQVIMKSMNRLQKLVFYIKHEDGEMRQIHICDTYLFLTLSLDRIVSSIRKQTIEENKTIFERFFMVFKRHWSFVSEEDIDHILRKNIFPYKFFTSPDKLNTPIEEFFEIFKPKEENLKYFSERVTIEDLAEGMEDTKHVMDVFRCTTARDYHDLYLRCDVLQLADVFDRSMNILWESHHIHLTKYLGMPSASWAAFLRHDPNLKIQLYVDTFYAEFFKAMTRGGITSAPLRHAVADDRHSIIYLDVNGLYPHVMQAYNFPMGDFSFIPMGYEGEMCEIKLLELFNTFNERGNFGMAFCVDMHFPSTVKKLTDMYPFAPEHRRIYKEYFTNLETKELSPYLKRWSEANENQPMKEFKGLVCTLYDKEKYCVHWRLLKFYMEHGVKITKVWFAVSFTEGDYLASYVRKNIAIRNTRKDELGKTLYKLISNALYGKTYESPIKRNTYEIIRDPVKVQGMLEEGRVSAIQAVNDNAWIVRVEGEEIVLDKPTYIGACVCEFSKLHMYTLLYDKLCSIFPSAPGDKGCELVYTDTDSFIVRVRHPDGVGSSPADLFSYIRSKDPTLIGPVGGQVKSETGEEETIQEIYALRSKVYAYKTTGGHIGKRAKGTTHDAQDMQLEWETYQRAFESLTSIDTRNVQFVRETFKVVSIDVFRQSLSVNDGKRYICEDGTHTHAFGYDL